MSELTASKRQMFLLQVECSDALFQGKERLVDLCTVEARLSILVDGVGSSFAASQIDEAHFAKRFVHVLARSQLHLKDSMRAR